MAISTDGITVVTATSLEARAARRYCRSVVRVAESGIALSRLSGVTFDAAISCGVAGGLRRDLPTGTVLIPREVRTTDGRATQCDPALVASLRVAAVEMGYAPVDVPLLSSSALVTGDERAHWAELGLAGVDMETAFLSASRLAAVRVILDTPDRELSKEWLNPARAMLNPSNWPRAIWLAREGPRCATIAARIVGQALGVM
jgi:hypothetical protein